MKSLTESLNGCYKVDEKLNDNDKYILCIGAKYPYQYIIDDVILDDRIMIQFTDNDWITMDELVDFFHGDLFVDIEPKEIEHIKFSLIEANKFTFDKDEFPELYSFFSTALEKATKKFGYNKYTTTPKIRLYSYGDYRRQMTLQKQAIVRMRNDIKMMTL